MLPWILAHWEEYHTGTLIYGTGWYGVMEGNYTLAIIHLLVYVFGVGMWTRTLNEILPFDLPVSVGEPDILILYVDDCHKHLVRAIYPSLCLGINFHDVNEWIQK